VAKQLADFFNTIHRFPLNQAKALGIKNVVGKTNWRKWAQKIRKNLPRELSAKERDFIEDYFNWFELHFTFNNHQSLIHDDLYNRHIFINAHRKINGVIDFTDIKIAEPAKDFESLFEISHELPQLTYGYYKGTKYPDFLKRAYTYHIFRQLSILKVKTKKTDKQSWTWARQALKKFVKLGPQAYQ